MKYFIITLLVLAQTACSTTASKLTKYQLDKTCQYYYDIHHSEKGFELPKDCKAANVEFFF